MSQAFAWNTVEEAVSLIMHLADDAAEAGLVNDGPAALTAADAIHDVAEAVLNAVNCASTWKDAARVVAFTREATQ